MFASAGRFVKWNEVRLPSARSTFDGCGSPIFRRSCESRRKQTRRGPNEVFGLPTTLTTRLRTNGDSELPIASSRRTNGLTLPSNPLWGAPRIHDELRKLGIEVAERTVSRFVRGHQRPPSQTWRTFLTNHLSALVSMDFFTVPTLTGRVLFVLVLLAHQRRRVVHVTVTEHPTVEWTAQQIVAAFPEDSAPQWLLRDRDATYGEVCQRRVAGMGKRSSDALSRSPDRVHGFGGLNRTEERAQQLRTCCHR
jgi:hypothetical protein